MELRFPIRLKRSWPLAFSASALYASARMTPSRWRDFEFSRYAVPAHGWYTDLSQSDEYYHYAYAVGNTAYEGRALYADTHSGIYYRKPGDKIGVMYLSTKRWVSKLGWNSSYYLRNSERWATLHFFVFVSGIWSSAVRYDKSYCRPTLPQASKNPIP
jgi:hypothetical protein